MCSFNQYPPPPIATQIYNLPAIVSVTNVGGKDGKKGAGARECVLPSEDSEKPTLYRQSCDGGSFIMNIL